MSNQKGIFITFEGIDGIGKSTQIRRLADYLRIMDFDVVETKEPGSPLSPLGHELRQVLFHTVTTKNMAPGVADCILLADHIQHVSKIIEPALAAGKLVLSDRYADSQFGYGPHKNCPDFLMEAYTAGFGPMPNLTLLFTGDPNIMMPRANARRGESHQKGKLWNDVDLQKKIQNTYLDNLLGEERLRLIPIVPDNSVEEVAGRIQLVVNDYLDIETTECYTEVLP